MYVNMYNAGLRYAYICQRASSWSQTGCVGVSGLWCQVLEPVGSLCHPLERVRVLAPATGLGMVCVLQTTYWGVQCERGAQCWWLEWDHRSQAMCLVLAAGGLVSVSPPDHVCGVCYNIT